MVKYGSIKNIYDTVKSDIVGHGFLLLSVGSAIANKYINFDNQVFDPILFNVSIGGSVGAVYHYWGIHDLNTRFKKLLEKVKDKPNSLKKLDDVFENLKEKDLSDRYTCYLYNRQKKKIFK